MYDHTTVQLYNCTTVQGATFNIRGQLYCGHTNATALFSSPVVSALALSQTTWVLVLAGAKKNASSTFRLG